MGLFSRPIFHSHPKLVVTVDVPAGSVEAALALAHGAKVSIPAAVASVASRTKRPLRFALRSALEALSRDIHAHGLPLPKEAVALFSSPSYRTTTEIIRYEENADFKVTPDLVRKLLDAHYAKDEDRGDAAHLIGSAVNGYRARDPYGLFGKTLELFVLKSGVEKKAAATAGEEILRAFHLPILLEPFALPLAVSLPETIPALSHGPYLIVSVSGRATEILHFEDGLLLESASFPVGSQDLLTSIARGLRATAEVLHDRLRLSRKGHAELSAGILQISGRDWLSLFEKASEMLAERSPIPQGLVLIAPEELMLPLETLIKRSFTAHRGLPGKGGYRNLPILPLAGDILERKVAFPGSLRSGALGLSALFAHTHRESLFLSTSLTKRPVLG